MFYNNFNTVLEYIWIGGNGEIRSKTRVLNMAINKNIDMPCWNYDGSSTNQADSNSNTEVILKPCKLFKNPFINDNISTYINNNLKYDVITSLFDTINHLLDKKQWELIFKNASSMLHDNGIFVFDICTKKDLEENWPNYLNIIDNHDSLIISKGEYIVETKISRISHTYFKKINNENIYVRKDDSIDHISFDINEILVMLNKVGFINIEILDLDTNQTITDNTNVAVFLCKKL